MRGTRCRWCNQPWTIATRIQHTQKCPATRLCIELIEQGKPHPSGQDSVLVFAATLFNGEIERID